jgi:hypothetical protein
MSGSLGFSVRASLPSLDAKAFNAALQKACRDALIKAARKFLLAALPRVPIYTGFARGSFGTLEDAVGRFQAGGGSPKIETTKKGVSKAANPSKRQLYYYPPKGVKVLRNTLNGRTFATKTSDLFSQGRAKIATGESAIFFRFSVDIEYFNYLDRNKWGAFQAGTAAFDTELRAQLDKLLPKIKNYLIRKEVK